MPTALVTLPGRAVSPTTERVLAAFDGSRAPVGGDPGRPRGRRDEPSAARPTRTRARASHRRARAHARRPHTGAHARRHHRLLRRHGDDAGQRPRVRARPTHGKSLPSSSIVNRHDGQSGTGPARRRSASGCGWAARRTGARSSASWPTSSNWGLDRPVNPEFYSPQFAKWSGRRLNFVLATDHGAGVARRRPCASSCARSIPIFRCRTCGRWRTWRALSTAARRSTMILLGDLRRAGAGARRGGDLRRDGAPGGAADSRNRRPHDARRTAGGCARLILQEGSCRRWLGWRIGLGGAVLLMRSMRARAVRQSSRQIR